MAFVETNRPHLPDNWHFCKLNRIAYIIDSLHKTPQYSDIGIPMARVTDIKPGFLNLKNAFLVTQEIFNEFTRNGQPEKGDIVFSRVGTYGLCSYVNSNDKFCLGQNTALIRPRIDSRYVYFALKSPLVKQQIENSAVGSTQKTISLKSIGELEIPICPTLEMESIVSLLGALDDKIELNRRMNETLEAMARAIFKSWFVDFDPVLAKAEGREPAGMDAETAALFPDSFEETELGMVPKGWRIGKLDELLVLQRGFDLPSDQRMQGPYQVISASGPSGCHIEYKVQGPGVTTGRSGLLGKVFFIYEDFWPLNTSLWVKDFRVSQPHHAYFLLKNLGTEAYNAGSAVPTLNRNHIHKLPAIVPTKLVVALFEKLVTPLFNKIQNNQKQSITLAEIRDRLLPELLSGKLRIKKSIYN